uniref:Uncharacterized protein n=1 Tax=viral metagenome TaxID=1070528 RepID=A0A6C0EVR1_9ZZZZ
MDVPRINIDDLYESKKKNNLTRLDIYNKLLIKIHAKIKMASRLRNNDNFCSYIMPEVLIGYPNYNFEECLVFIIDKLQNDGFLTRYIHPNLLLISWNHWVPMYVRDEIKKKTGKQVSCYGELLEEKDKSIVKFSDQKETKNKTVYDDLLLNFK